MAGLFRPQRTQMVSKAFKKRFPTGLALFLPIASIFIVFGYLSPAYYQAEGKLRMRDITIELASNDSNPRQGLPQTLDLAAEMELISSNRVIVQTLNDLRQQGLNTGVTNRSDFLRALKLMENEPAKTITLTYQSPVASHASAAVNTLMNVYLSEKKEINQIVLTQAQRNLQNRLPQAKESVTTAQAALNQFQRQYQIGENSNQTASASLELSQAQQRLSQLRAQNSAIEVQRNKLLQTLDISQADAQALIAVSQSNEFKVLLTQLRQLENKLVKERNRFTEVHPAIVELKRDIQGVRDQMNLEVQRVTGSKNLNLDLLFSKQSTQILTSELVGLENQQQATNDQINKLLVAQRVLKQRASNLPVLEQQLKQLQKRFSQAQSNYQALVQKNNAIEIALKEEVGQPQILSPATLPQNKLTPYRIPILWSGLGLGLIMGLLAMWIAEVRDRRLNTVEATKIHLGLKILGIIPTFEQTSKDLLYDGDLQRIIPTIFPLDKPGSPASESFRMLYLNLKVLPESEKIQSIAITSSVPQEGKSTIAANLGAVIAQAGKSVLVVDANLKYPFQDLIWNLPNNEGLSNVLMSQTSLLLSIHPITSNLDVLTSGSIRNLAKNPFESKQMKLLLADLSSRYDVVIFDLPPVNTSADAAIVSQLTDGVIFVARPGYLDEFNATKAMTVLENSQTTLLGMVLNVIDDPKETFIPLELEPDLDMDLLDEDFSDLDREQLVGVDESNSPLLPEYNSDMIHLIDASATLQSMNDLEEKLEKLQSQWSASKKLISQKEEELIYICQAKQELQIQLNKLSKTPEFSEKRVMEVETVQKQIQHTEERKQYLISNLQSLRDQVKSEQETFYAHLQILQARHGEDV